MDYGLLGGIASFGQGFLQGMERGEDRKQKMLEREAMKAAKASEAERRQFDQELDVRKAGFLVPEGGLQGASASALTRDPEWMQMQKDKLMADPYGTKALAAQKGLLDLEGARREKEQAQKGYKLAPDKVLQVQQGAQIPKLLQDVRATLEKTKNIQGPIQGRLGQANPYNVTAQASDAQIRAASQAFGRYMEGGVLRKEDEEKYLRMFPNLTDTPEVAARKLAIVEKMLVDKQNADVEALRTQGYDVSGFQTLSMGGGADDKAAKLRRLQELRQKAGQ